VLEFEFEEGTLLNNDKIKVMEIDCLSEKQSGIMMFCIKKLEKELELV